MEEDLNPDAVSLYIQEAKHFFKYKCTTSMSHSTLTLLHEEKCSQQNSLFTSNALQMYKVRVFFPSLLLFTSNCIKPVSFLSNYLL